MKLSGVPILLYLFTTRNSFTFSEIDYEEADNDPSGEVAAKLQQTLTFYELDLGLNHVVRKYSEPLEEHGNFLVFNYIL